MFKLSTALAVALTAAISAAHADTIIIQGTPSFEPAIITHGEPIAVPDIHQGLFDDPAFARLMQMCETMGLACGPDQRTAEGGIAPEWTPEHRADAQKRLAQMLEEREAYAEALEEHFDTLPAPHIAPLPRTLFGWTAPLGRPHLLPRPYGVPGDLSHLFPSRPPVTLPYAVRPHPVMPNRPDLSGFFNRLHQPGTARPFAALPRHGFPWRSF